MMGVPKDIRAKTNSKLCPKWDGQNERTRAVRIMFFLSFAQGTRHRRNKQRQVFADLSFFFRTSISAMFFFWSPCPRGLISCLFHGTSTSLGWKSMRRGGSATLEKAENPCSKDSLFGFHESLGDLHISSSAWSRAPLCIFSLFIKAVQSGLSWYLNKNACR